ncbi:hypothetical protein ACFVX6_32260 [Streptomyces sp. NPDC058289]|uniref:hypothetical protein n=1 Tax=Streptomyces sp. NPDC058289 TaxID=3346425 RepID=UPI0036E40553
MPLHTDSAPPAHFRARVADHGRLTDRPPYAQSLRTTYLRTQSTSTSTSSTTNTTTENG